MKRSRMREMTVEVTVGVVMFMILLALGVFTIVLSRENVFKKYYPIRVRFETVAGLADGDNVYYHGVKIGVVKSMDITKDGIVVAANLDYPVTFYRDYAIKIESSSVLGGHQLAIQEGTHTLPVISSDEVLKGDPPISLIDDASATFSMLKKALQEGGILTNFEQSMANIKAASADFKVVSDKLAAGQGTLGKLLMDDTMYDELHQLAANLNEVGEQLAQGRGTLGKLINSDELYQDLQVMAADIKKVTGELAAGKGTLGKLMNDDSLYVEISAVSSNLAVVTDRLVAGEGTLGKLSRDDALYDEVKVLVEEAIATLDDLRETSPITSFASIFFGAF